MSYQKVAVPEGDVLKAAREALANGLCVLPPKEDGSKKPDVSSWKRYQEDCSTIDEVEGFYANGRTGLGIVCGAVSGNLEMLETETWEVFKKLCATAKAVGLEDLWKRVVNGYTSRTPSGGTHHIYRCREIAGNTKLARRPKRADEMREPEDRVKVLIETRGEHGFTIEPPSHGSVHESGKPYEMRRGGFASIATISPEERADLLALARSLDEMPPPPPLREHQPSGPIGERPGDRFNAQVAWADVLEQHGWQPLFTAADGNQHWRRPGKARGTSATTKGDHFYCFSSSTPFEPEQGYTRFAAFAVLSHGGDYSAAASALGADPRFATSATPEPPSDEPAPEPLQRDAFPVEVLPPAVRAYVEEASRAIGVEPDMVAVPAVVSLSVAIGASRVLELKPGWTEAAVIWATVVARPGSAKTPTNAAAAAPLHKRQADAFAEYRLALDTYDQAFSAWDGAPKEARGQRPVRPVAKRYLVDDTTIEKLADILNENQRGVGLARDELAGWVRSMNQYKGGQGADRSGWLSLWSLRPITVDRKNRETVHVLRPFVSVFGCLVPDMLEELRDQHSRDDGFLDRILFSCPSVTERRWRDDHVSFEVEQGYQAVFKDLLAMEMDTDQPSPLPGLPPPAPLPPRPRVVHMTAAARAEWIALYDEHHAEMDEIDFPAKLYGPFSKMDAYAARLTLVLHLTGDRPDGDVGVVSVQAGWALVDYFKSHAKIVYDVLGKSPLQRRLEAATEWLRRRPEKQATRREMVRAGVAGVAGGKDAEDLLAKLEERGYVTVARDEVPGGTKVTVTLVRPAAGGEDQ